MKTHGLYLAAISDGSSRNANANPGSLPECFHDFRLLGHAQLLGIANKLPGKAGSRTIMGSHCKGTRTRKKCVSGFMFFSVLAQGYTNQSTNVSVFSSHT